MSSMSDTRRAAEEAAAAAESTAGGSTGSRKEEQGGGSRRGRRQHQSITDAPLPSLLHPVVVLGPTPLLCFPLSLPLSLSLPASVSPQYYTSDTQLVCVVPAAPALSDSTY